MADVHDKATRSKNMRAIATRDTASVKKRLASVLTEQGVTFRVQDATLPGRPDFVVDDYRCVIFTHGCFGINATAIYSGVPATRTAFWLEKIGKNVQRDAGLRKLQALGWRVLIVWECALRGAKSWGMTRCPNASRSGSAAVATVRRSTPSVFIYCNVFSDGDATASACWKIGIYRV